MKSVEQLHATYPFSDAVVAAVGETAAWQDSRSFRDLADYYGVADGPQTIAGSPASKPFQVLHFRPKGDYDKSRARVLHLPMANQLDAWKTMRAIRLFGADPATQLFVFGNQAYGSQTGRLRLADMPAVWRGDLTPVTRPAAQYVSSQGIQTADQLGYSYGADRAASAAQVGTEFGVGCQRLVAVEPAAVANRGLLRLTKAFAASGEHFEAAFSASQSRPLIETRALSDPGTVRYGLSLLRMGQLAIGHGLSLDGFEGRLQAALHEDTRLAATVAWGTASELVADQPMQLLAHRLAVRYGERRVQAMRLRGMTHAGGDNINLHAAIMLQALHTPKQ